MYGGHPRRKEAGIRHGHSGDRTHGEYDHLSVARTLLMRRIARSTGAGEACRAGLEDSVQFDTATPPAEYYCEH